MAESLGGDPNSARLGGVLRLSFEKYLVLGGPTTLVFNPERLLRPEVSYLEIFITPDKHVRRTNVPVLHVLGVEQIQRLKHLDSLPLLENIVYHLFL